jgi:hypothetical protein
LESIKKDGLKRIAQVHVVGMGHTF